VSTNICLQHGYGQENDRPAQIGRQSLKNSRKPNAPQAGNRKGPAKASPSKIKPDGDAY
jgi:hypothetical protein